MVLVIDSVIRKLEKCYVNVSTRKGKPSTRQAPIRMIFKNTYIKTKFSMFNCVVKGKHSRLRLPLEMPACRVDLQLAFKDLNFRRVPSFPN
jgi:hypothetical protein